MHDIHSFFKSINFICDTSFFDEVEIEKVVLNKKMKLLMYIFVLKKFYQ